MKNIKRKEQRTGKGKYMAKNKHYAIITDKSRESSVSRLAEKLGYVVDKGPTLYTYQVLKDGVIICGEDYSMTLEGLEKYFHDIDSKIYSECEREVEEAMKNITFNFDYSFLISEVKKNIDDFILNRTWYTAEHAQEYGRTYSWTNEIKCSKLEFMQNSRINIETSPFEEIEFPEGLVLADESDLPLDWIFTGNTGQYFHVITIADEQREYFQECIQDIFFKVNMPSSFIEGQANYKGQIRYNLMRDYLLEEFCDNDDGIILRYDKFEEINETYTKEVIIQMLLEAESRNIKPA